MGVFPFDKVLFLEGEVPLYAGVPLSSIVEKGYGIGDVISLLWFKRSLPRYCTQFIEVGYSIVQRFPQIYFTLLLPRVYHIVMCLSLDYVKLT